MGLFDFLFRRKKEENVISFEEETVVSPVTVEEDPAPAVEVETKPQPAVSEKKKPLTKKPTASTHKKPVDDDAKQVPRWVCPGFVSVCCGRACSRSCRDEDI